MGYNLFHYSLALILALYDAHNTNNPGIDLSSSFSTFVLTVKMFWTTASTTDPKCETNSDMFDLDAKFESATPPHSTIH